MEELYKQLAALARQHGARRRSGGWSARLRRLSGFMMLPPFKEGAQVAPCAQRVTSLTVVHSLFKGCSV